MSLDNITAQMTTRVLAPRGLLIQELLRDNLNGITATILEHTVHNRTYASYNK